jgi:hypothetical protein
MRSCIGIAAAYLSAEGIEASTEQIVPSISIWYFIYTDTNENKSPLP